MQMIPNSKQTSRILALLARVLVYGLSSEQRITVLRGMGEQLDIENTSDEVGTYVALMSLYADKGTFDFVVDLTERIKATQSFYRNVGPELAELQYLLEELIAETDQKISAPHVFVLMPYREEFLALYEKVIRPALRSAGCTTALAKDVLTVDSLVDVITEQITRSTFLVADTTGKNPNVFYELGYAHALGKKVILITQNVGDIPFDISGLKHIEYALDSPTVLQQELKELSARLLQMLSET